MSFQPSEAAPLTPGFSPGYTETDLANELPGYTETDLANELVEWFNQVDATYRSDLRELNELNFARFDAKLAQRIAQRRPVTTRPSLMPSWHGE
jgi:hypothetical protein